MIMQVRILKHGGNNRFIAEYRSLDQATMPHCGSEIALADTHKRVQFGTRGWRYGGNRAAQRCNLCRIGV